MGEGDDDLAQGSAGGSQLVVKAPPVFFVGGLGDQALLVEVLQAIGEEYQNPLIVTGTVLFMELSRSNMVTRTNERLDAFGQRSVNQQREFVDQKGFVLRPKFIFIDGRTGATLHSEISREQILYGATQAMPALSSYFELMDRLVPNFLSALSSQKIRGTRVLLQ